MRLSLSVLLVALVLSACSPEKAPVEHPNIVWITSEDNSKHYMDLFDEHGVKTPNIESLADHGITFTRAFSNSPVCSAARSTLISGVYGPRISSHYHRKLKMVPMPQGVEMFPAYLRKAGYYTTNNSKEDYNIIKSDSVWDESSNEATWRKRKEGRPFFHVQNIGTTHESGLFFTEEDMKSADTLTDRESCFIHPYHPQTEVFKYTNARYRDKIVTMDRQLGDIVDQLVEDGLLENTFIFYFGDHGGVLPGSKGYIKEIGVHVPLVVYIPPKYEHLVNVKPGTENEAFVSFLDFGATVLNLAGAEIPEEIDGKPFLGKDVTTGVLEERDESYSYADRFDEKYDMVRAVRKGKFKYIRNYQPFNFDGLWNDYRYKQTGYREWMELYKAGELNEIQASFFEFKPPEMLFDLETDPYETVNLAGNTEFSEVLKQMHGILVTWEQELPDLSFYPEHYLVKNAFDNPIAFGQQHKGDIQEYLEVADLMLLDFNAAKPGIKASLGSEDPWKRYWGIIVCSSFRKTANDFLPVIKELANTDTELINRVRAAEFIGIIGAGDPSEMITDALYETKDAVEALLILNTVVLLQDAYGYFFDIELDKFASEVGNDIQVNRRLSYLVPA